MNYLKRLLSLFRAMFFFKKRLFLKSKRVYLGENPKIINSCFINFSGSADFGARCWVECVSLYKNKEFSPIINIGNYFSCGNDVHLGAVNKIIIGNNVLLGSFILISDHSHGIYSGNQSSSPDISPIARDLSMGSIVIGDHVWIGDGVKIIGNVKIGAGSIIGAGSVVVKDIPANVIACGNPAKVIKKWSATNNKWLKEFN